MSKSHSGVYFGGGFYRCLQVGAVACLGGAIGDVQFYMEYKRGICIFGDGRLFT
jgi:hypothetical protein